MSLFPPHTLSQSCCFKRPCCPDNRYEFGLCTHFCAEHESDFTWGDALTPLVHFSNLSLFSFLHLFLFPSSQWRGLRRAEQTRHTRFHLLRPTLTHKLPANRPPPIYIFFSTFHPCSLHTAALSFHFIPLFVYSSIQCFLFLPLSFSPNVSLKRPPSCLSSLHLLNFPLDVLLKSFQTHYSSTESTTGILTL